LTGRVVLILTHPDDVHANEVEKHLRDARIDVYRTDTAGLGSKLAMVARFGGEAGIAGTIAGCDLARVGCVWHRRPSEPAGEPGSDPGGATGGHPGGDPATAAELRAGIGGVLAGLPHLNHPADMAAAALKPYQLVAAARHGLRVPETVLSTDAAAARDLARRHDGRVVVKPISRGAARFVTAEDRSGWSRPIHLTQQRIDKTHDIRLTIVDGELFAVRIDSPYLDWRTDPDRCRHRADEVPPEVAAAVRDLMAGLRLRFGALDFAIDHSGQWWFLEVNPNGQWLWLEHATGLPISRAIAAALTAPIKEKSR
jgi:hypothetical protein